VSRLYRNGSGVVRRFFAKTGNLRLTLPLFSASHSRVRHAARFF